MGTRSDRHVGPPVADEYGIPPARDWLTEFVGTAALMTIGLSAVVLVFSTRSPVAARLTDPELRRLVAGFFFVATAAAVIYSPLGRRGGGHLNPAVTLGFLHLGKLRWQGAAEYVVAQLSGALVAAAFVLLVWGAWARSVNLGATTPGRLGPWAALAAELVLTFVLVSVVFQFVDRPRLMRFTPVAAGLTTWVCILVEAPASTTSLNPARTLGPDVVADTFHGLWIYLLAPPLGALLAAVAFGRTRGDIACAKLVHTDEYVCHFRDCAYREAAAAASMLDS
jgi:aquaporin Z